MLKPSKSSAFPCHVVAGRAVQRTGDSRGRGLPIFLIGGLLSGAGPAYSSTDFDIAQNTQLTRVDDPITLDGRLTESTWSSAPPVTRFLEIYPANLGTAGVTTEVRFLHREEAIYIGIRAYDPSPSAIRSFLVRRDQVLSDQDYIELLLDPLNSRQSAVALRVNPDGVATDALFTEATQTRDYSADFDFDAKASIDSAGWTAEFRIPLSTLRYDPERRPSGAFVVIRNWPRHKNAQLSSAPIPLGTNCVLCFAGQMNGIPPAAADRPITVTPHITYTHRRSDQRMTSSRSDIGHAGIDLKWQPRSDTSVDFTVAPDFSQVEADDLQLTANTRFALFVQEKRPFFLESAEVLASSPVLNPIYTRTFTEPDVGARVTRKGGTHEYSALVLRDAGGGSIIEPGPITSRLAPQEFESTAFAGRYKIHANEVSWGTLASVRLNNEGSSNFVVGADATWSPSPSDRLSAEMLWSQTRNPDRPDLLATWVGQQMDGAARAVTWEHTTKAWYATLNYTALSPGFRSWNGFISQVGVSSVSVVSGLDFRFNRSFLTRVSPTLSFSGVDEVGGSRVSRTISPGIEIEGARNTAISFSWNPYSQYMTPVGMRAYSSFSASLMTTPAVWIPDMSISASAGEALDVTTGEVGDGLTIEATLPLRFLDRLEFSARLAYQSLNTRNDGGMPSGQLLTERYAEARGIWHFSNKLYSQLSYQRSQFTTHSLGAVRSEDVEADNKLMSLLVSYQTSWQTRFLLGFRRSITSVAGPSFTRVDQTEVFAKLSYVFHGN